MKLDRNCRAERDQLLKDRFMRALSRRREPAARNGLNKDRRGPEKLCGIKAGPATCCRFTTTWKRALESRHEGGSGTTIC